MQILIKKKRRQIRDFQPNRIYRIVRGRGGVGLWLNHYLYLDIFSISYNWLFQKIEVEYPQIGYSSIPTKKLISLNHFRLLMIQQGLQQYSRHHTTQN